MGFWRNVASVQGSSLTYSKGKGTKSYLCTSSYELLLHVSFEGLTMVVGLTRMGNWAKS
jgi:hypothetical protein